MCRGAKVVFSQNCRDVKNEIFETKMAFICFCLFCVEERQGKKKKKQKTTEKNSVLGRNGKIDFVKIVKLQNMICVRKVEKGHFR